MESLKEHKGKFDLMLDRDWFKRKDVITDSEGLPLKILSVPKKRDSLVWKVLRFLTFGKLFLPVWSYKVKIIDNER